jgi:hypothetical protein
LVGDAVILGLVALAPGEVDEMIIRNALAD